MLFNSVDFAIFLPIVFVLYWFITNKNLKVQNALLIMASYLFYGWWDWRFLSLIIFSSSVDYLVGIGLSKAVKQKRRKLLLLTSVFVNLGFLGFFKYFNFFSENFAAAFSFMGQSFDPARLSIILPVGISFYTFQTLSYTIDVYRNKIKPTRDVLSFFAFVSFFPQLVAGPIERATNLLPQFYKKRKFDHQKSIDGLRQILWGLFKKVVIADNCAEYANMIFSNTSDYSGSTLILGAVFFTFQIYGDFSGYSDIAIGTARLFGFDLRKNFAFPYFSRDIAEFWRRWHISLSTWFRDYLYIPLGGSRGSQASIVRNVFIIFLVSGFWHGANWTFVLWGAINALYFLPLLYLQKNRKNIDIIAKGKLLPSISELSGMTITFGLTVFAWIFFRAESISHAFIYVKRLFGGLTSKSAYLETYDFLYWNESFLLIIIVLVFISIEWIGREGEYGIAQIGTRLPLLPRWAFYYAVCFAIFIFAGSPQDFIYFQF